MATHKGAARERNRHEKATSKKEGALRRMWVRIRTDQRGKGNRKSWNQERGETVLLMGVGKGRATKALPTGGGKGEDLRRTERRKNEWGKGGGP